MAERNEQVLEHVRQALEQNPALSSTELYQSAREIDPSVADDSLRSFHARYVLSLKRSAAGARRGGRKAGRKGARKGAGAKGAAPGTRRGKRQRESEAERTRIRGVFLQFAREVAGAETRAEVVNVVGSVDRYVDDVMG